MREEQREQSRIKQKAVDETELEILELEEERKKLREDEVVRFKNVGGLVHIMKCYVT